MRKYNQVADEVFFKTIGRVVNTSMKQGQDSDDYFMEEPLASSDDETMGKTISDRLFQRLGQFAITRITHSRFYLGHRPDIKHDEICLPD